MYTDQLTHIQQRIATIVAFTQRRGVTTWVIAGVIGVLFENYVRKEMDSQALNGRLLAEISIFTFSLLYLTISIPMLLHGLLRKGDPRKVIIPPSRLTGHFTLNFSGILFTTIIAISALYLVLSGQNTTNPAVCWANLIFHGYMSAYTFRNELKLTRGEILPGLHNYALKELTKVSVFPSILRGKMLILLIIMICIVLSTPAISVIAGFLHGHWFNFLALLQTKAFWPVLGIFSLSIYMIMRESPYREIRSLMILEKLLMRFPDISDAEFGFLLHATRWETTFLSYAQFLIRFNQRQFNKVTEAFNHLIELKNRGLTDAKKSEEYYTFLGDFNTLMQNYSEYNSAMILWLSSTIPNVIGEEWQSLLDIERQMQSTLGGYSSALVPN